MTNLATQPAPDVSEYPVGSNREVSPTELLRLAKTDPLHREWAQITEFLPRQGDVNDLTHTWHGPVVKSVGDRVALDVGFEHGPMWFDLGRAISHTVVHP